MQSYDSDDDDAPEAISMTNAREEALNQQNQQKREVERQAAEKRSKRREQQTKREEEAKRKKAKEQTLQKKIQENEAEADGEESESSSEEDNGFISLVDKKIPIHNKQINKKKKQGKKVKNLKVVALNSMVPFGEEAMSKVVAAFQKDTMNQNKHRIPTFLMASQKKTGPSMMFATGQAVGSHRSDGFGVDRIKNLKKVKKQQEKKREQHKKREQQKKLGKGRK